MHWDIEIHIIINVFLTLVSGGRFFSLHHPVADYWKFLSCGHHSLHLNIVEI